MDKIQIVILAAGLGKRMNNKDIPKALTPLRGKPLISYILSAIKDSGICEKPAIVVGHKSELVKRELGSNYIYVDQIEPLSASDGGMATEVVDLYKDHPTYKFIPRPELLGTGHAVMKTKDKLKGKADDVMVLYSDQPLVSPKTIKKITTTHLDSGNVLTMGTVIIPDFNGWREGFYDFGRVIRNQSGKLQGIIEKKDANNEQLNIKEINPGYYCFKADWLWQNLDKLKNNNAQGEYYLTDLIDIAFQQGEEIATVEIDPKEALGVNNEEHLKLIEELI